MPIPPINDSAVAIKTLINGRAITVSILFMGKIVINRIARCADQTASRSERRRSAADSIVRGPSQRQMKKLVEGAPLVVRERFSVNEAALAVQRQGWIKVLATARFQAEPHHPSRASRADNALKKSGCNPTTEKIWMSAHRFQFPGAVAQILQCPDSRDLVALPYRPHRYVRGRQPG